ncbi:Endonuclease YncB, thermonuclease family [Octadecabacter temperatus]|uniref:Succinoglycan biosynthesis protein ExoI n=1 Tax=Octadecabacter temperatus TaxID=1458307 RepID=A0A0K0Y7D7_9RHOB|nr:thermonuclease family protein [Octadecabacter temperatus]AKS46772.1 Succinoglycan biosynthesis protein ExoI [Octadecabacter temperatus]SIO20932.1 Endonuclease YncB, thermonuclease family [Octadecabacter temperatus]
MFRILSLILCLSSPALADVEGRVRVVDGDTLDVSGQRVRLHGIDAPETEQTCEDAQGSVWPCGAFVREEVARRYQGVRATCHEIEQDRYGRSVAKCFVNGRDIGETLVSDGWARAYREYSMDYDLAEKSAQVLGLGLWASSMQEPSAYRAEQRVPSPDIAAPDANCIIKGNISGSGRIYHMPHNRDYANTRINEASGERWFCSETEARSAGWRAARN